MKQQEKMGYRSKQRIFDKEISSNQDNASQTILRLHLTMIRFAMVKSQGTDHAVEDVEQRENSYIAGGRENL